MSHSVTLQQFLTNKDSDFRKHIHFFLEEQIKYFESGIRNVAENGTIDKISSLRTHLTSIVEKTIEKSVGKDAIQTILQKSAYEYLANFYGKMDNSLDDILFDETHAIVWDYIHNKNTSRPLPKEFIEENPKCFKVGFHVTWNASALFFFKNIVIITRSDQGGNYNNYEFHNIPNNLLFAIKYFSPGSKCSFNSNILKEHPEYFQQNCSEFEKICKTEYGLIEKQKDKLNRLILENNNKKEYYTRLEEQIKETEKEKQLLKEESTKIRDAKKQLIAMHEKINKMKTDIQNQQKLLEREKEREQKQNECLDEYFEYLLFSEN